MPSTGSGTLNKYQHPQQISAPSTNSGTAVYTSSTGRGTTQERIRAAKHRRTEAASSGDNGTKSQEGLYQDHRSAIKLRPQGYLHAMTIAQCMNVLVGVGEGSLYSRWGKG